MLDGLSGDMILLSHEECLHFFNEVFNDPQPDSHAPVPQAEAFHPAPSSPVVEVKTDVSSKKKPSREKRQRTTVSSEDMTPEKLEKLRIRREKNKAAASASRAKVKAYISSLEQKVVELEEVNKALVEENERLKSLRHEPPEFEVSLKTSGPGHFLLSYSGSNSLNSNLNSSHDDFIPPSDVFIPTPPFFS